MVAMAKISSMTIVHIGTSLFLNLAVPSTYCFFMDKSKRKHNINSPG